MHFNGPQVVVRASRPLWRGHLARALCADPAAAPAFCLSHAYVMRYEGSRWRRMRVNSPCRQQCEGLAGDLGSLEESSG